MSERELVLTSIGPVQDFIATARRCQDLWFGSWLLSELSAEVARGLESEEDGCALVFPGKLADGAAVANKILADVPRGAGARAARNAEKRMRDHLEDVSRELFDRYAHRVDGAMQGQAKSKAWFHRDRAMEQVRELIELQWVVVPLGASYADARRQAEQLLALRKQTRTWPQTPGIAGVPKSSLDGVRESILDEAVYDEVSDEERQRAFLVKKAERLCGVGLLKRVGLELPGREADVAWQRRMPQVFHSSSHVAAGPVLTRIASRGDIGREAVATYLRALEGLGLDISRFRIRAGMARARADVRPPYRSSGSPVEADRTLGQDTRNPARGYDGVLLFESRLEDAFTEASEVGCPREVAREAGKALRDLRHVLGLGADDSAHAYYAFLQADGDRMGAVLDALAKHGEAPIERHREMSARLDAFASAARDLVERHGGSLVYSGGDDVLALVPLHTVLDCAEALREGFEREVAAHVPAGLLDDDGRPLRPSLSVGIGVAHHLDSMRDARALAKSAETAAKDHGRNAIAIAVAKRAGSSRMLVGSWDEAPHTLPERLRRWAERLSAGDLPHAIGYELEQAARPFELGGVGGARVSGPPVAEALTTLVLRALNRRRTRESDLDEGIDRDLGAMIEARIASEEARTGDPVGAVRAMADEMNVARLFERTWSVAWGREKKEEAQ